MSRLEARLIGDNIPAQTVLKAASATLKLLRGVDKNMHGKVTVVWNVDIYSTFKDVVITFRAEGMAAYDVASKAKAEQKAQPAAATRSVEAGG